MTSHSTDRDLSAAGTHIGQSLDQLRADIAALSETVARLASEGAASARSQIRDSTGRATRGASAAGEQIYENAAQLGRDAADTAHIATAQIEYQIARNPLATVLIALGLGFALGAVSRR
jgi:ElaB/YqjD/DUF883 family membrane-anchored ribosome-binding protein